MVIFTVKKNQMNLSVTRIYVEMHVQFNRAIVCFLQATPRIPAKSMQNRMAVVKKKKKSNSRDLFNVSEAFSFSEIYSSAFVTLQTIIHVAPGVMAVGQSLLGRVTTVFICLTVRSKFFRDCFDTVCLSRRAPIALKFLEIPLFHPTMYFLYLSLPVSHFIENTWILQGHI